MKTSIRKKILMGVCTASFIASNSSVSAGEMSQGEQISVMTVANHACKGQNACKGQGGCKSDTHACKGQNACKGQGSCKVTTDNSVGMAAKRLDA